MYDKEYIYQLIEKLENENLDDDRISVLAKENYISVMQLYRDFYSITGHSVKEYVRKRRLSKALFLIKFSEMNLTEIVYFCGYNSQQAFNKYFKKEIGITPTQYKASEDFYYFPKFGFKNEFSITVDSILIPATLKTTITSKRNDNMTLDDVAACLKDYKGKLFGENTFSCNSKKVFYFDNLNRDNINIPNLRFSYIPSRSVQCAVLTVPYSDVEKGWNYLLNVWLEESMFIKSDIDVFEEYFIKKGKIKKLKLYLPLSDNKELCHIKKIKMTKRYFIAAKAQGDEVTAAKRISNYFKDNKQLKKLALDNYLVQKDKNFFYCGVEITEKIDIADDLILKVIEEGEYLMLTHNASAVPVYERALNEYAMLTNLKDEENAFTLYKADDYVLNGKELARTYIKIKNKN